MEIYSCDTMVALGNSTKSNKVVFAKNSDRPINEAQPFVVIEAQDHSKDRKLKCTYIEIEQIEHTYKVFGSTPYWLWGFEHGMNEHNVVIGNEAVWSKEPEEEKEGLLGMDLLRLGLERGKTAYEALKVITSLLEEHGQGGNAAVNITHKYHNAFLIADSEEAWILDTVGRRWVARRVKDVAGISNCYSTEEHWDEGSSDIKEYAYQKGWACEGQKFNFAKAYSAMTIKHRNGHPRFKRLNKLLEQNKGQIDKNVMKNILRDHFEGEIIEPRFNPADGLYVSICMHAMETAVSKTAASTIIEIESEEHSIWWGAFSNPCTSVFAPYYIDGVLPIQVSHAGDTFSEKSLGWKTERLNFAIEVDYPKYYSMIIEDIKKLEKELEGDHNENFGKKDPTEMMVQNVQKLEDLIDALYSKIKSDKSISDNLQRQEYLVEAKKMADIKD